MTGESVTSFRKLGAVMGGGTQNNNNNHPLQSIRTDEIEIQVLDPQHNHHQDNVNKNAGSCCTTTSIATTNYIINPSVTGPVVNPANPVNPKNNPNTPAETTTTTLRKGWVCCAPCIWLHESTAFHKMAITMATLLVTFLLVASPILFLISAAPSRLPRDCTSNTASGSGSGNTGSSGSSGGSANSANGAANSAIKDDDDCVPLSTPSPECSDSICRGASNSIQVRMNWTIDPCEDFKTYSCSPVSPNNMRIIKSPQEMADLQMQQLLSLNTTFGTFKKLGHLYKSCLKQTLNSSTVLHLLDKLGGYLPKGSVGPSSISGLITQLYKIGPVPIINIYYDLSFGKKPHILLIIDGPNSAPHNIMENPIRWLGPKPAPYNIDENPPELFDEFIMSFLPSSLTVKQLNEEKQLIYNFIKELNQLRRKYIPKDFTNSNIVNDITMLQKSYSYLNWNELIPQNWTNGTIVVRSPKYLQKLDKLITEHEDKRVVHNSILILFALNILPSSRPTPHVCTKATIRALPQISSALFTAQYSEELIRHASLRTEYIFESMKAHLKRAPSLRGQALVRLSQLKIQSKQWPTLFNRTRISEMLDEIEISSDNWFENVLRIYQWQKRVPNVHRFEDGQISYAYPTIAKAFYDALTHSIVVPISIILVPYFNPVLPPYLHYATLGTTLAKEILRSITKSFEDKVMQCVPSAVDIFSNSSRMDLLIHSGGLQISYHSLLSLTGPIKGMERLPGLDLTPTQIFYLVSAQELCAESEYSGVDVNSEDFSQILTWLISQDDIAGELFECPTTASLNHYKTCDIW